MSVVDVRCPPHEADLLDAVGELRVAAWSPTVGAEAARDRFRSDAHDEGSTHFVIVHPDSSRLMAAGRLTICRELDVLPEPSSFGPYASCMSMPLGVAGRLVVDPRDRGLGLAGQIIVARLAHARRLGLAEVWSETRVEQADGFLRHGYGTVGPSDDRTVPGEWAIFRAAI